MGELLRDRRIVRARRDGAAYRIAEAIADGVKPAEEDIVTFRAARKEHRDMIKLNHPSARGTNT